MAGADGSGQIFQDRLNERLLTLTRVEAGMQSRVLGQLSKIEREIIRQLAAADLTDFQEARLRALLANVQGVIRSGYTTLNRDMGEQLGRLAVVESNWALSTLNAAIHTSLLSTAVPVEQVLATARETLFQGAPLSDWLGRQASSLQERFGDQLRLGVSLGETNQQIMNRVRGTRANRYRDGVFEVSRREASALVRTAAQTIANNAREELFQANTDLVTGQVWVSTLDGRTSDLCIARDGLVWDMNGKPVGHSVKFRRPPIHWNCLPGDALVLPVGRISAASKRWVDGEVVVIKTAGDRVLAATPNHPVLTRRGWVEAGRLEVGDHVVSDARRERRIGVDGDREDVPSPIQDVVESFLASSGVLAMPVPVAAPDFHGDGAGSKVAVVGADRHLRNDLHAALLEHMGERGFVWGGSAVLSRPVGASHLGLLGFWFHATAHRLMSFGREGLSFLRRCAGHARRLLLAAISGGDAKFSETALYDVGGYFHLLGNSGNSAAIAEHLQRAGHVDFDVVTSCHRENYSGNVFNIETESGCYVANGIVTHNCRSVLTPKIASWEDLGIDADELSASTRASMDGQVPASTTYEDWLKGKPASFQDSVLGKGKADLWRKGKISLRELINNNGRPLTLEQLEGMA